MGEFWWAMVLGALYGALIFMWIFTLIDLFGRSDLSGLGKVLWLLAILFLPILGVIGYFVTRPDRRQDDVYLSPAPAGEGWYTPPPTPSEPASETPAPDQ
ncbi:MAG TPA: PLD nuclease N-terminal domain-containing protein [Dehalococcoidia bacterium]|nr:PLD nuclease N-terminal domain-containing protein [Dehalococcoidia bacterium]